MYLINAILPNSLDRVSSGSGLETPPTIYEIGCNKYTTIKRDAELPDRATNALHLSTKRDNMAKQVSNQYIS